MSLPREILHVISALGRYGAGQQLADLAQVQVAGGQPIAIAALAAHRGVLHALTSAGVECLQLERRWMIDPAAGVQLSRAIKRLDPKSLQAWDTESLVYAAVALRKRPATTLTARLFSLPEPKSILGRLLKSFSRRVEHFELAGEYLHDQATALGIDPERLSFKPPTPPTVGDAALSREDLLAQLALPADAKLVVLNGPLTRAERIDDAIWAFELVRVMQPAARLVVVGDGPQRAALERFARLVSDPGIVTFVGDCDSPGEIVAHANMFWQQSSNPESLCETIAALAAGVNVVARDTPFNRELLTGKPIAHLIAPGDRAGWGRTGDKLLTNP